MSKVKIVIVNYKTTQLTIDCLQSLESERELWDDFLVELIDNASPDSSGDQLREAIDARGWSPWVNFTQAQDNGGFARGNNIGLRKSLAHNADLEFALLLNPDTIVFPGAIKALADFLDNNPRTGIAGSRLEELDGAVHVSAFRFANLIDELNRGLRLGLVTKLFHKYICAPPVQSRPHQTDWVSGASFMVRRKVFEDIGLLDEGYFMYYEEADFCKRAQNAGWECWYVPTSRVIHLEGQSSGIRSGDPKPKRRPSYLFESRRRFFQKHYGRGYAILADLAWLLTYPLWRVRRRLQQKTDRDPGMMWWDMFRHSSIFHGIDRTPAPSLRDT